MKILAKKKCPSCGELVDKDHDFCLSCDSAMSGKRYFSISKNMEFDRSKVDKSSSMFLCFR